MWSRYLKTFGVVILLLIPIATYRDVFVNDNKTLLYLISRVVLSSALGIGIYRRNIWTIRLCYVFGMGMLFLTVFGMVWFRYPDLEALLLFWPMILLCGAFAITFFVPVAELTGRTIKKVASEEIESENPYRPPGLD